jgi:nicotinate-nucleotide pyrophosphorylase (carboxylating)
VPESPDLPTAFRADAARLADLLLAEDGGSDLTSEISIPPHAIGSGVIEAREPGVAAAQVYAETVVEACGLPGITWNVAEGCSFPTGAVVGSLTGLLRAMLRSERPMLNLMQRGVGIATLTRRFVEAVEGTGCRILHTRKTAPGLRLFDVAAVLAGGGQAHRLDLSSEVMIKGNHWTVLQREGVSLSSVLQQGRRRGAKRLHVEVESVDQVRLAAGSGATRILIDNQRPETVKDWGNLARSLAPKIEVEATGGITLSNVRDYAEAGIDFVSIGALTHSVQAADLSLEVTADSVAPHPTSATRSTPARPPG